MLCYQKAPQKPWAANLHQRQCAEGRKAGVHTKVPRELVELLPVGDFYQLTHKETEAGSELNWQPQQQSLSLQAPEPLSGYTMGRSLRTTDQGRSQNHVSAPEWAVLSRALLSSGCH